MSISEFKSAIGYPSASIEVLRNKSTDKLFMNIGDQNFRVQGNIDESLPIRVLVPVVDGVTDLANSCLINIDPSKGAENIFSL